MIFQRVWPLVFYFHAAAREEGGLPVRRLRRTFLSRRSNFSRRPSCKYFHSSATQFAFSGTTYTKSVHDEPSRMGPTQGASATRGLTAFATSLPQASPRSQGGPTRSHPEPLRYNNLQRRAQILV